MARDTDRPTAARGSRQVDRAGPPETPDVHDAALSYGELFPAVYLRFHRRDGKQRPLSGASRGVLLHLAQSGPLTIGECARHLARAQSVVSEIVRQLERHGLLARTADEQDRRRTLVWLTEAGRQRLVEDQEVLSRAALGRALARMQPEERSALLRSTRALVDAAVADHGTTSMSRRKRR